MNKMDIFPPLIGAMIELNDVPDLVFADKMVGDGVAIDPFDKNIYAPVTGIIKSIHSAKHAITITSTEGIDILVHIGIETVGLNGEGFYLNVTNGEQVNAGDLIGEFDIDFISCRVKSLISPVVIVDNDNYKIKVIKQKLVSLNKPILQITFNKTVEETATINTKLIVSPPIIISNLHGIHARPAALISKKAREFTSEVFLEKDGKTASAKSVLSLLNLSVTSQDTVFIHAGQMQIIDEITNIINGLDDSQISEPDTSAKSSVINNTVITIKVVDGRYYGIAASDGDCIGYIVKKDNVKFDIIEDSSDNLLQQNRLYTAIDITKAEIEKSIALSKKDDHNVSNILSAHLELLNDSYLINQVLDIIKQNKTAEYALTVVIEKECQILANTGNKILIERQVDLHDIYKRIIFAMDGIKSYKLEVNKPSILISDDLTPSEIIGLDKNIVGIVLVKGGITSHVAILAKSREIPLLVGVDSGILDVNIESKAILDTKSGFINISPTAVELEEIGILIIKKQKQKELELVNASSMATTVDNVKINCLGNIANISDLGPLAKNGADGIGLFRTEFIFLDKDVPPTAYEQEKVYSKIATVIDRDKPFIIRTLDAGGDKKLAYLNMHDETNPVLGVRGIRLSMKYQETFIEQLTAILKVNHPNLKVMLPMISNIEEFRKVKKILENLISKLAFSTKIELGIMVEVPSVALQADIFAKEVDFFSIGTNDLSQYILAIDRENFELTNQIDHLHPAVLRSINLVVEGANKYNKNVSVCGVMASEKISILVLIGLGIKSLSMNINSIPENKAFIRRLNYEKCREDAFKCLDFATNTEVRQYLSEQFFDVFN